MRGWFIDGKEKESVFISWAIGIGKVFVLLFNWAKGFYTFAMLVESESKVLMTSHVCFDTKMKKVIKQREEDKDKREK